MSVLQKRIKEERLKKGYTLAEIAELINVKEATVQRYESGEIKNIKHETITQLAEIFECSPAYLMGWDSGDSIINLTPREEAHIIKYRKLDDHSKDVVDTIIDKELERSENNILHRVPTFEEMYDEFENKILSTDNLGDDGYIHEAAFGGGVWKEKNEVDE